MNRHDQKHNHVEYIPSHLGHSKGIVEFPIGEQFGIRGDLGTVELELQAAAEIDAQVPCCDLPIECAMNGSPLRINNLSLQLPQKAQHFLAERLPI